MVKMYEPAQVTALIPVKSLMTPARIPPKMPPMSNKVERSPACWLLKVGPSQQSFTMSCKFQKLRN